MIDIIRSNDRGQADHGWLKSYHSFSFADYYDPVRMGYRTLRVINEDFIEPGKGFGTHPHRDMEIFSYIVKGALAHKDSMGNVKTVHAGEVQSMSAGRGVTHSEFNPSETEATHLLQIWILPNEKGLEPSYAEWRQADPNKSGLTLIASPDRRDGSLEIHQDCRMYLGRLGPNSGHDYQIGEGRGIWVQLIEGSLRCSGKELQPGDAAVIESEKQVTIESTEDSLFILFDLK